jgi:hypothetical protein
VYGGSLSPSWGFAEVHSRIDSEKETQMEGKTHHFLKAGIGWKFSDQEIVPGGTIKERKERKGWEISSSEKMGRGSRGWGG